MAASSYPYFSKTLIRGLANITHQWMQRKAKNNSVQAAPHKCNLCAKRSASEGCHTADLQSIVGLIASVEGNGFYL